MILHDQAQLRAGEIEQRVRNRHRHQSRARRLLGCPSQRDERAERLGLVFEQSALGFFARNLLYVRRQCFDRLAHLIDVHARGIVRASRRRRRRRSVFGCGFRRFL